MTYFFNNAKSIQNRNIKKHISKTITKLINAIVVIFN